MIDFAQKSDDWNATVYYLERFPRELQARLRLGDPTLVVVRVGDRVPHHVIGELLTAARPYHIQALAWLDLGDMPVQRELVRVHCPFCNVPVILHGLDALQATR